MKEGGGGAHHSLSRYENWHLVFHALERIILAIM